MTRHATRKTLEREYQAAFPEMTLTVAKRHLAHAKSAGVIVDGDIPLSQLGGAVLPPEATPAQRARAEAIWEPADAGEQCRCTGNCAHGRACTPPADTRDPADQCTGTLIHLDRYPGGMWTITAWADLYECTMCGEPQFGEVELPAVPWGEQSKRGTVVFDGVRHPAFAEVDGDFPDDPEPECECGADHEYRCVCR